MGNQPGSQFEQVETQTKGKKDKSKKGQKTGQPQGGPSQVQSQHPPGTSAVNYHQPGAVNSPPGKAISTPAVQPQDLLSGLPNNVPSASTPSMKPITTNPVPDFKPVTTQMPIPAPSKQAGLNPAGHQPAIINANPVSNQPQPAVINPSAVHNKPNPVNNQPPPINRATQPPQGHPQQPGASVQNKPPVQQQPHQQPPQQPAPNPPAQAVVNKPNQEKGVKTEFYLSNLKPLSGISLSACHLNITSADQFLFEATAQVMLNNIEVKDNWVLYAPIPPLTSFQAEGKLSITLPGSNVPPHCEKILDTQGRELIRVIIPINQHPHFKKSLKIIFNFEVILFSRELYHDPNVQLPCQVATEQDLIIHSSDGGLYALTDSNFQNFVTQHSNVLFRNPYEVGDQTIIYAQRVFHFISEHFEYFMDHKLDRSLRMFYFIFSKQFFSNFFLLLQVSTIQKKKSDAGGLALLFCAILRLQEVPARILVGRWTNGAMEPHAITEFYVEQIGWIPADIGSMVNKGKKMPKPPSGKLPFFGEQPSNFLALHYETTFHLDTLKYGIQDVFTLQEFPYWVSNGSHKYSSSWKLVGKTPV